ncbi:MAG: hypothetical protein LBF85_03445 [Tannerella sp.]|jgi:hypothetical protein|nr:hypothetical protein [Tannerella sp.]
MKRTIVLCLLLCVLVASATAQHTNGEQQGKAVLPDRETNTPPLSVDLSSASTAEWPVAPVQLTLPEALFSRNMPAAYGIRGNTFMLLPGVSFIPYGERAISVGAGEYSHIGAMLRWQLSENLSLEGGGFAGKQYGFLPVSGQNMFGFNAALNRTFSGRWRLAVRGRFMNAAADPGLYQQNLFMNPYGGMFLEYDIRQNLTVGGGVGLEYDRMRKKWMPVGKMSARYSF